MRNSTLLAAKKRRGYQLAATSTRDLIATARGLENVYYGKNIPRSQNERVHWGRSLDLDDIDRAIRAAARGNMVMVTDMAQEQVIMLDGHTTGALNKRLNRSGAIAWDVVANTGQGRAGYDHERAKARADFVRSQILRIPMFRERLMELSWSAWNNRAALEIGWEVGNGASVGDSKLATGWRVNDLYWIHPRRLSYDQNRDVVIYDAGAEHRSAEFRPVGYRLDDLPEKFVVSTPRLFNDYREREGLILRCLYWSFFQRLGTRERLVLMEIFGSPWRFAYSESDAMGVNEETIKASFETLANMSAKRAAWLAPGVKPLIVQPGAGAGAVHKDVIDDARAVISKFILGGVATSDAVATGLGSSIGDVQLSEEDMIIAVDLLHRASVIEHRLIDVIIELNYGPDELEYAPLFEFDIRGLIDREKNLRVINGAIDAGLSVAAEQAYQMLGLRQPRADEPRLQNVQVEVGLGATSTVKALVYPAGKAPPPGELPVQPLEALELPEGEPKAPPALPPAPTPEEEPPPPVVVPEERADPESSARAEDDEEVELPFESPSGIKQSEREVDD